MKALLPPLAVAALAWNGAPARADEGQCFCQIAQLGVGITSSDVAVLGDRAYVAGSMPFEQGAVAALYVLDISNPADPSIVEVLAPVSPIVGFPELGTNFDSVVVNDAYIVFGGPIGCFVTDTDAPGDRLGFVDTGGTWLELDGAHLWTAGGATVHEVDVPTMFLTNGDSVPWTAPIVGTIQADAVVTRLKRDGDRLYISESTAGVHIYDAATRTPLGVVPCSSHAIAAAGDLLIVKHTTLSAFNVADPAAPLLYSSFGGLCEDAEIVGDTLFVANNSFAHRLDLFDISDPTAVQPLGSLGPDGSGRALEVQGGVVYLIDWGAGRPNGGLTVVDAGACLTPACPADLDHSGNTDSADLNILLADFGCQGPACDADIDNDRDTDSADLNALLAVFGSTCQ